MAEMERVFADLTALADMVTTGEAGLPAIQRLVEITQYSLDATGASFAEYGPAGGRVIAASGDSLWAVGRQVEPGNALAARVVGQGRVIEARVEELPDDVAGQLVGRGIRRILGAWVEVAGNLVGTLHAFFQDEASVTDLQRSLVSLLGAAAGHMYGDSRGLPVYAEAPAVARLADAIAIVGPDGLVRSWNPAAASVTGRSTADALGRPLPIPLPGLGQAIEHRLPGGRRLQVLATELPGGGGRVVTMRDVTEAYRHEQARELFVALTSHELRTPVTVIKGYADTLVEHMDNLDDAGRLDAARRLGQRAGELARLVERLLSAVGDGSGLASAVPLPFDLGEALRSAIAELPAETRRLVRVSLPDGLPKALGQRASLATVLSELVTNAIKYSPPDSPVQVTAAADAGTVGFRVADSGIGVRPEHVERAFERFWQAESGNDQRHGGVGLGLYLVRRIIERQNGWVSLRPREWGGTVADVRLPRADLGPGEA
jgi:two-component system, OmpR family, phosphate regulon sensor histidine kinase PhoR